jgi:EPS-associated MarR family transcriptional regulator
MTPAEQAHLRILKIVDAEPEISQRQLAERLGVSLGKANYLIKALLEKGHLKAGNFLRAENKLKYAYLLTPEGLAAKLQLTRDYLARKEQEYVAMKTEIETMRDELAQQEEHDADTRAHREEYKSAVDPLGKHPGGL